jgi:ATP-binding protein involved in chromosome partitioning
MASFRTYHQVSGPDASGILDQVVAQRSRVRDRLATVRRLVAVMSGKGGVGKSFVTARLAQSLARSGSAIGVLDADLNGPTIPRLLGLDRSPLPAPRDGVEPALSADGIKCISMAQLLDDGRPLAFHSSEAESFVWRGAQEAAVLRELLSDVAWGTLDMLLIDLPPGILSFLELCDVLPEPPEVLTVTIPTPESADAVRRALVAVRDRGGKLLGIVENMVGSEFTGDAAAVLSHEFAIPVLARIPWHPTPDTWHSLSEQL